MKRFAVGLGNVWLMLGFAFGAVACDKTPEPAAATKEPPAQQGSVPSASASSAPAPAPTPANKELTWQPPASFQVAQSPGTMRKATYKIPKAKGDSEDAEVSVISAGGGLDANIDRWAGQFEGKPKPKRSTKKVGELDVTLVELDGTFNGGGMPGAAPSAPKAKWRMLAAIVEVGGQTTFFKLTGPDATVNGARKDFDALVASFSVK